MIRALLLTLIDAGTGDNARHDNDPNNPRTPAEIYELNTMVANRMADIFTTRGIPVVPSIGVFSFNGYVPVDVHRSSRAHVGNNDIWRESLFTYLFNVSDN